MVDDDKLKRLLNTVGKGTFVGCYDVFEKYYMKADKSSIDEAVEMYGKKMGWIYKEDSIVTKRNAACQIFSLRWQREALALCNKSTRVKNIPVEKIQSTPDLLDKRKKTKAEILKCLVKNN